MVSFGLPTREEEEAEACYRSFATFVERAWPVVEEDTPLLMEMPHRVICEHVQELLQGFVRVKLYELAGGQALPRPSTARLPHGRREREVEVLQRQRLAHLWAVGERLEVVLRDGRVLHRPQFFNNLLVNMGPGYGKSRLVSVMAPTYLWLLWPAAAIGAWSVNGSNAAADAARQKALIKSDWFQRTFRPWWQISREKDAETHYRNTADGRRRAVGWGAKVQGEHVHLQVIDDPEDPEDVYSDRQRQLTQLGWDGRIRRRVHPGGASIRLASQQRLIEGDWSDYVKRTGEWEHLELSTEAELTPSPCHCPTHQRGHTLLGWRDTRKPGELLAPRLVPSSEVVSRKLSPTVFRAQDQQRPEKLTGNLFPEHLWRFWRFAEQDAVPGLEDRTVVLPPREQWPTYFEELLLSGDLSFGQSQDGSADCLGVWGRMGAGRFLLDLEWGHFDFIKAKAGVRRLLGDNPGVGPKVIELAAQGGAVMTSLASGDDGKPPIEGIIPITVAEKKVSRALAIQHLHAAGNIFLPLHHPRRMDMVAEAKAFPDARARNDFVDSLTLGLRYWLQRGRFRREWLDACLARGQGKKLCYGLEVVPPGYRTFTGAYLAAQQKGLEGQACFFTLALRPNGTREVLHLETGRFGGAEILARVLDSHRRYQSTVVVENEEVADFIRQFSKGPLGVPLRHVEQGRARFRHGLGFEGMGAEMGQAQWVVPSANGQASHEELAAWVQELQSSDTASVPGSRAMASLLAREGVRLASIRVETGRLDLHSR